MLCMIQNVYNSQGRGSVTFSIPSSFPFRYVLIPTAESTHADILQNRTAAAGYSEIRLDSLARCNPLCRPK